MLKETLAVVSALKTDYRKMYTLLKNRFSCSASNLPKFVTYSAKLQLPDPVLFAAERKKFARIFNWHRNKK